MSVKKTYYAGIGSRETPRDILFLMRELGFYLGLHEIHKKKKEFFILRSGGARGADRAFEKGVRDAIEVNQRRFPYGQIFLPKVSNSYVLGRKDLIKVPNTTLDRAWSVASAYHPNWENLSHMTRLLHRRNVLQILGIYKTTSFVICWTPDGADGRKYKTSKKTGGTGTAIRVASQHSNIPVFNLYQDSVRQRIEARLARLKEDAGIVYEQTVCV